LKLVKRKTQKAKREKGKADKKKRENSLGDHFLLNVCQSGGNPFFLLVFDL
jgi:hypothetical protein